jgi:hypothetical protein
VHKNAALVQPDFITLSDREKAPFNDLRIIREFEDRRAPANCPSNHPER